MFPFQAERLYIIFWDGRRDHDFKSSARAFRKHLLQKNVVKAFKYERSDAEHFLTQNRKEQRPEFEYGYTITDPIRGSDSKLYEKNRLAPATSFYFGLLALKVWVSSGDNKKKAQNGLDLILLQDYY